MRAKTDPTIVPIPPAFVQNELLLSLEELEDKPVAEGGELAPEPGEAVSCDLSEPPADVEKAALAAGDDFEPDRNAVSDRGTQNILKI